MRRMRRFVAILLILFVPLQLAWSAVQGVHGHVGEHASALGFHTHDGDHAHAHDSGHSGHDGSQSDNNDAESADGSASGHFHPVFVSLVIAHDVSLDDSFRDALPPRLSVSFTSRTPPLFDWPPSVRR